MTRAMSAARLLAIGSLACAGGCIAADIINVVSLLPSQLTQNFSIAFWVTSIDLLLLAALLAFGSLTTHPKMVHHFGFLQYSAGTGMLLMFLGSMTLGMAGKIGLVSGATAIAWGALSVVVHCVSPRTTDAPRNEPLLPS